MARVVKNTEKQVVGCDVITKFKNGTEQIKHILPGDIVEGLRYIENETLKSVTGRVVSINTAVSKITKITTINPKDYFATDVVVKSLLIDCSDQYFSKTVTVPAREIVEDEGILDVVKVDVFAHPYIDITLEYTDGTTSIQNLEISDVITNVKIMAGTPGKADIEGNFKIVAFDYTSKVGAPVINGTYLKYLDTGKFVVAPFKNYLELAEENHSDVTDESSLSQIAGALAEAENGVVYASLGVDVTVPKRDDGRITTLMVGEGQTLNMDLSGHNISCQAYAFYVNGGVLNISDSTGTGRIECTFDGGSAFPAVYVASGGTCNMDGGIIDTTKVPDGVQNWLYGVVCSGDGVFNMTGGEMIIKGASGISITNGTASGEGAKFTIGGDAKITSLNCAAIYLADNKSVDIKDNAVINGGITARMGDITISGNAVVNSHVDGEQEPLAEQIVLSGVASPKAGFIALTGIYNSALGNDMNVVVKDNAVINGKIDDCIDIATINTKYDQKVVIDIEKESNLNPAVDQFRVYGHDELADLVAEIGKTLAAETNYTDLTVKIGGQVRYPAN